MTEIWVSPGLFLVDKPTGLLRWNNQILQQEFEMTEYIGDVPTNRELEWRDVPVVSIPTETSTTKTA